MRTLHYFIICICFSINLSAQQANVCSGGNASGTGGTASYSLGQVNYTINTSTTGSVSQGVQLPYEIFALTGVDEAKKLNINLIVFPNPTVDYLILRVESTLTKNLSYQLFDNDGKEITSQKLDGATTKVEMNNYAAALYFLTVTENKTIIKTFKIIKN